MLRPKILRPTYDACECAKHVFEIDLAKAACIVVVALLRGCIVRHSERKPFFPARHLLMCTSSRLVCSICACWRFEGRFFVPRTAFANAQSSFSKQTPLHFLTVGVLVPCSLALRKKIFRPTPQVQRRPQIFGEQISYVEWDIVWKRQNARNEHTDR